MTPDRRPNPQAPEAQPDEPLPGSETPLPSEPDTGPATPAGSGLAVEPPAVAPGGEVTVTGHGCDPGAPVRLSIGDGPVGDTTAGADGGFDVRLSTGDTDIGHHRVTADCGRTLAGPLDIVLVSRVGGATSTATVLLFFLLIGGWYYGHRLVSHLPARRPR
ncbi:hypothetical protein FOH10_22960 [Nocardia otitidiscaviarum]|uniref:Bacterial Ig domain-containing protein n=1 Tax=Nocardia otitidiscaviarum TaxID=1823 RepID=A0A516NQH5_9NOCA|nr:hypothetical protein [Nocardia otitidiscaviarum]MCP9620286.1 hypothetical protein [Nocardia otitidiscaviarum]QDP81148.1 hypothetical protein FOH10_22960 [Nocardia otitidiscaviarum]